MLELASLRKAVVGLFIYCSKVRVFDMTFLPILLGLCVGGRGFLASCVYTHVCACVSQKVNGVYLIRNNKGDLTILGHRCFVSYFIVGGKERSYCYS